MVSDDTLMGKIFRGCKVGNCWRALIFIRHVFLREEPIYIYLKEVTVCTTVSERLFGYTFCFVLNLREREREKRERERERYRGGRLHTNERERERE